MRCSFSFSVVHYSIVLWRCLKVFNHSFSKHSVQRFLSFQFHPKRIGTLMNSVRTFCMGLKWGSHWNIESYETLTSKGMIGVQSSAPNFGSYTKNSGEIEKSRRKTSFGDIWMCSLWCAELIASLVACWIIADGIVALLAPSFTELCLWMFQHGNFSRTVVRLRLDYYNKSIHKKCSPCLFVRTQIRFLK